ncbi:MAG: hypothetical protein WCW67_07270 [Candidatus Margulisiibacteriota bacterium]|jgi:DNA repair exonuclease SbcCD ATPase subunit
MPTAIRIDRNLINAIRAQLPKAKVRADLRAITDRVINPVTSGAVTVPADIKLEIEALQAQLLQIVPTLPKGAAVAPIDLEALAGQSASPPVPPPGPLPPVQPPPPPNPGRQLLAAQQKVGELEGQLTTLQESTKKAIEAKERLLSEEKDRTRRLEVSLGTKRQEIANLENDNKTIRTKLQSLETVAQELKDARAKIASLETGQQATASLNADLLKAQGEINRLASALTALQQETKEKRITQAVHAQKVEEQIQKLTEEKQAWQAKLEKIKASTAESIEELYAANRTQGKTIAELTAKLETATAQAAEQARTIAELTVEIAKTPSFTIENLAALINNGVAELQAQLQTIKAAYAKANLDLHNKAESIEELDFSISVREAQIAQTRQDYDDQIKNTRELFDTAAVRDRGIQLAKDRVAALEKNGGEFTLDPERKKKIQNAKEFLAVLENELKRKLKLDDPQILEKEKTEAVATLLDSLTMLRRDRDALISEQEEIKREIVQITGQAQPIAQSLAALATTFSRAKDGVAETERDLLCTFSPSVPN